MRQRDCIHGVLTLHLRGGGEQQLLPCSSLLGRRSLRSRDACRWQLGAQQAEGLMRDGIVLRGQDMHSQMWDLLIACAIDDTVMRPAGIGAFSAVQRVVLTPSNQGPEWGNGKADLDQW